ncbi:hypothetical protein DY000_02018168 [Brassica cretica]|uniref:Uncharacterized protein n=1 Tax=Brassica cretica TaxID=69181 RepID=A0ABQ7CWP7_BRACR|nr:hypothetical protein DY000_02018168 [Brassica cretica]
MVCRLDSLSPLLEREFLSISLSLLSKKKTFRDFRDRIESESVFFFFGFRRSLLSDGSPPVYSGPLDVYSWLLTLASHLFLRWTAGFCLRRSRLFSGDWTAGFRFCLDLFSDVVGGSSPRFLSSSRSTLLVLEIAVQFEQFLLRIGFADGGAPSCFLSGTGGRASMGVLTRVH